MYRCIAVWFGKWSENSNRNRSGRANAVAKGRVATDGDWAGITDVWVSPDHRRRGLALVVMDAMLSWSAERGAGTAYLQVRGDNAPGLALYAGLGFRTHHTYRYLAAPTR